MLRNKILAGLFSLGVFTGTALAEDEARFFAIDFPGAVATQGDGIGPGGEIVGHYTDTGGKEHGFLLSGGNFTSIDYPGAIYTDARGIGPEGDIVGSFQYAPGGPANWHGYLLSHGRFTEILVPGYLGSFAQRITPTGAIYGCAHDTDFGANMRGFVRHPDGSYDVFDIPSSMHNGATPDGRIIAGLYTDMTTGLTHGYRVVDGTFEPFDVPGSNLTQAWDINPAEEVAGYFRDAAGHIHGFLRSRKGAFTSIDFPGAITTEVIGINPAGDMVGLYVDSSGKKHAFLRNSTGRDD